ncbi:very short patch repair endonuclease [Streptomyces sp. AK010]|uniref:very short patch repair endonuclease n=1 Tax=Streptomyces sp. AK010 TaxID=2723074 RepID=UPI00184DFC6A|nr:very short patch repair endonuclease [Streptomyces sp. AK010]MBB6415850.1 DNA mismatch endonuclease (patch repair protein) [Streptomyces sp. AK010]
MTEAASDRQRRWKDRMPPDRAWKPRAGISREARASEQDRAAGSRLARAVDLGEGRYARASIALRLYRRTRRIRAYLRWSQEGETQERYVGEVDAETRAANLAQAWEMAHAAGLVTTEAVPPESWASSAASRAVMSANKGRDTKPEKLLRSALHRQGLRYRVGARPLPGLRRTADVVFTKARVAVFVDGCYWHGCPEHHRPAKKGAVFWQEKIAGNRARDAETNEALRNAGWLVIRVWEHEDPEQAARAVVKAVKSRQETGPVDQS